MRRGRTLPALAASILALTGCVERRAQVATRAPVGAPPRSELVVAQDGSGTHRTIQEALDAIPRGATDASWQVVRVRNGTYREKLFVRSGHIALVGEDRDRTVVVFSELRRNWRATHDSDWGAAVVNIGDDATDLFIGNLTVHNDYGSRYGDHDHQFAIRSGGGATRIVLVHARVVADGGDTLSLWNTENGMYYHADCDFEGWVDFVCPRGWCYVTGSRFFGHSLTASIWHDGSKNREQRFVIRRSSFDGVPGFPLGRNNRDGQFFLLDARFSTAMADRPIYRPSAEESYLWPPRVYFWNCAREGSPFPWFADNLRQAEAVPRPRDVTAKWTFQGRWDAEEWIPPVLPFASVPRPETGDGEIPPVGTVLRWSGAHRATRYRVFFGSETEPSLRAEATATTFDPGPLSPATTYRWRVDAVTPAGIVEGPLWNFRTTASMRVVLVGDSTVTDEIGWGMGLKARLTGGAECVNLARKGRSSKSFRAEGRWDEALNRWPDLILIQFGHNDMPGKGPDRETRAETTYRANLERYVDETRAIGATPVIVTPLARRLFGADNRVHSDLGMYVEAAKEVAREKGAFLVDLHARSIDFLDHLGPEAAKQLGAVKPYGTLDETHLSPKGSEAFGALVAEALKTGMPALKPFLR